MRQVASMQNLASFVGKEIGVSAWEDVSQARIDAFADCSGDRQWIHVDPRRARDESPVGGTIAHGFLTLSTLAPNALDVLAKPLAAKHSIDCGVEQLRFVAPVRAGARIRTRLGANAVATKGAGRHPVTMDATVEVEGDARPALTAQRVFMIVE